ncbi:helix-turn-helix domain-containing protein [Parapedobacter sp.]
MFVSDKSISEIGYECGYNSISNFNKQFSTITGLAPRAFRERYFAGFD